MDDLSLGSAAPRASGASRRVGRWGTAVRWLVVLAAVAVSSGIAAWQLRGLLAAPAVVVVEAREDLNELLAEGRGPSPLAPAPASGYPPPLLREPLDEATARRFFPGIGRGRLVFDPRHYCRNAPDLDLRQPFPEHPDGGWQVRTNSRGLREDGEPSPTKPGLRILVTGASNVAGLCANRESAANLLEAELRRRGDPGAEVLNAGIGGACFYNYLPVLEQYLDLSPDVFVLIAHGGTDFGNSLPLARYFLGLGPWPHPVKSLEPVRQSASPFVRQLPATELGQVVHMLADPGELQRAIDVGCSITAAIDAVCRAREIRFVCAYLPPPLAGQPQHLAAERAEALALLELTDADIAASDRIAAGWLAFLSARDIEHVDLRPAWRASPERLYWRADTHLDLAGQRAIAGALLPLFDQP